MAFLDDNGLLYFWQKIKTLLAGKVDVVSGKGLSTNDYTTTEKNKLAGLSNYSLPTASSTVLGGVKVGTNLSIAEGVLSAKDTTYGNASSSTAGLMSGTDKAKLDGIASGANNYSLPTASSSVLGGVKVGSNLSINSSGVLSATNTTYSVATSSANGLMSSTDKSKLDGFGAASTYALKSDITATYKYKGSKSTYSQLPTTGNVTGDVWDVTDTGMNYGWTGSAWDALGQVFTITAITNSEIDTILAS